MKFIYIIMTTFLLMGCQKELSYDYLISHPQFLQKQYEYCESVDKPECDNIRRAAMDFSALVKHQMQDPDRFGREIMEAQQQWVVLQKAYEKDKTPEAKKALEDQQIKLHGLYAVIALHTPE